MLFVMILIIRSILLLKLLSIFAGKIELSLNYNYYSNIFFSVSVAIQLH